jgi:hypothetical protein
VATGIVGVVVPLIAVFVPDIRERTVAFLGGVTQGTYSDAAIVIACPLLFFAILEANDRWFRPELSWALINSASMEPMPPIKSDHVGIV